MAEMKNQKLLNKALNLLPDLVETKVDAVQTVELYKNDNSIVIEQAVDYRKRVLKKGSRVCLDFGNHQVGYDFKSELQGESSRRACVAEASLCRKCDGAF